MGFCSEYPEVPGVLKMARGYILNEATSHFHVGLSCSSREGRGKAHSTTPVASAWVSSSVKQFRKQYLRRRVQLSDTKRVLEYLSRYGIR